MTVRIERVGPADLMFVALQRASVPEQFGVVLVIAPDGPIDPAGMIGLLGQRIPAIPRLRQRVQGVPPGRGRPIWVDDPTFTVERHVVVDVCPPPGDESAMLAAAAELLLRRLPMDRPLSATRILTGLTGNRAALVIVVQHALADGMGGLAILGALLEGSPAPADQRFPVPPPRRQLAAATVSLGLLRTTAHELGATVNDTLVSVVAGALHTYLVQRGELPLSVGGGGNVTATFAALSQAGTLTVMVSADPDAGIDLAELTTLVQSELDGLV